jgi:hypothetical protein
MPARAEAPRPVQDPGRCFLSLAPPRYRELDLSSQILQATLLQPVGQSTPCLALSNTPFARPFHHPFPHPAGQIAIRLTEGKIAATDVMLAPVCRTRALAVPLLDPRAGPRRRARMYPRTGPTFTLRIRDRSNIAGK